MKVDLATLVVDVLKTRFPTDSIYQMSWSHGSAIYVNHISYMYVYYDDPMRLSFSSMGVRDVLEHTRVLHAAHPDFFDKVKELTLRNLVYYEQDRSTNATSPTH